MPFLSVIREPDEMRQPRKDDPLPEWLWRVFAIAGAVVVAYYTSQANTKAAMARITERESNHYLELRTSMDLIRQDHKQESESLRLELRELRKEMR